MSSCFVFRDIMDIVDLEYGSYCDPLSNFKFKATYGVGEYTHDKFIYCGGYSTSIQVRSLKTEPFSISIHICLQFQK